MILPRKTIRTTTTSKHRLELTRKEIIEALQNDNYCVPNNAEVFVEVPGGGDYSNTTLDLDSDVPLIITWTETSETKT
jgi:hypothetical protein